jgi:Family of unknown function (DUF5677)
MTIDREGFLSADISTWIEKHRKENREWFELASDLNRVAHQQLALLKIPSEDSKAFTAALLFIRGLSNFQGAILTAERGMTLETGTLARSCFETVFNLGALSKSPEFIETLIADDADRRGKIARSLVRLPEDSGLEPEHLEKLDRFLAGLEESDIVAKSVGTFDAAARAGLKDIYNVFYRGLSNDSSHPSITALNRHVESNHAGLVTGLKWGPDVNDVRYMLSAACTAGVYLVSFAIEIFKQNEIRVAFESCWPTYKRLVEEQQRQAMAGGLQ